MHKANIRITWKVLLKLRCHKAWSEPPLDPLTGFLPIKDSTLTAQSDTVAAKGSFYAKYYSSDQYHKKSGGWGFSGNIFRERCINLPQERG